MPVSTSKTTTKTSSGSATGPGGMFGGGNSKSSGPSSSLSAPVRTAPSSAATSKSSPAKSSKSSEPAKKAPAKSSEPSKRFSDKDAPPRPVSKPASSPSKPSPTAAAAASAKLKQKVREQYSPGNMSANAAEQVAQKSWFNNGGLRALNNDPAISRHLVNNLREGLWNQRINDATRTAKGLKPIGYFGERVLAPDSGSGFRTKAQAQANKRRGTGSSTSMHLLGIAADIVTPYEHHGWNTKQHQRELWSANKDLASRIPEHQESLWGGTGFGKKRIDPAHFQLGSYAGRSGLTKAQTHFNTPITTPGVRPDGTNTSTHAFARPVAPPSTVMTARNAPIPRARPEMQGPMVPPGWQKAAAAPIPRMRPPMQGPMTPPGWQKAVAPPIPTARPEVQGTPRPISGMSYTPPLPAPPPAPPAVVPIPRQKPPVQGPQVPPGWQKPIGVRMGDEVQGPQTPPGWSPIDENEVTPPGYFRQFALDGSDMDRLQKDAMKDFSFRELMEMNRNKEMLPGFMGPMTRDQENVQVARPAAPPTPTARPPMQGPPRPIGGMSFTPGLPAPMEQIRGVETYVDPATGVSRNPYDTQRSVKVTDARVPQASGPIPGWTKSQDRVPAYPGAQPAGTWTQSYDRPQAPFRNGAGEGLPPGYSDRYFSPQAGPADTTPPQAPSGPVSENPMQEGEDPQITQERRQKYSRNGAVIGGALLGPLGAIVGGVLGDQMGKTPRAKREAIAGNQQALKANVDSINRMMDERGARNAESRVSTLGMRAVLLYPEAVTANPQGFTKLEQMLAMLAQGIDPETGQTI